MSRYVGSSSYVEVLEYIREPIYRERSGVFLRCQGVDESSDINQ